MRISDWSSDVCSSDLRGNYIEVRSDDVFERQPWALLEIFRLLQQHPKIEGIRAQTLRLILRDGKLLDDAVRQSVQARTLFIGMFREGRGLTRNLRRMNRYNVLGQDRTSTRLNSSHSCASRMPSSA